MFFNDKLFLPTGLDGIARSSDHRKDVPGVGLSHVLLVLVLYAVDVVLVADDVVALVLDRAAPRPGLRVIC